MNHDTISGDCARLLLKYLEQQVVDLRERLESGEPDRPGDQIRQAQEPQKRG